MALARDDVIKWIHVTDAYLAIFVMFFNCIACRIFGARYQHIYSANRNHFKQALYIIP